MSKRESQKNSISIEIEELCTSFIKFKNRLKSDNFFRITNKNEAQYQSQSEVYCL